MLRPGLIAISLVLAAACSDERISPPPEQRLNEEAMRDIASEVAVQKGMNLLCEREGPDLLGNFMEDLRYEGVDRQMRESIMAESVEMMNKISAEEPENICTPEMFESANLRVSQAMLSWDEMRGITQ
tara:strand:+ start:426 stop:809 length:384 start_codon:yes stop_codon:yes gene_type:complete